MRYPHLTRLLAVACLTGLATSCAAHSGGQAEAAGGSANSLPSTIASQSVQPSPEPTASSQVQLPLDGYTLATQQNLVISRAEQLLITDCMRKQGFNYVATVQQSGITEHRDAYGLISAAQAAAYGYHDPGFLNGSKRLVTNKPAYMTDSYLIALRGFVSPPPAGSKTPPGCEDKADAQLHFGSDPSTANLLGQLGADASQRTQADPQVLTVERRWHTCMAAKGFSFDTPATAAAGPWTSATQPPSGTEIATARADVACKQQVNLAGIWIGVESAYQRIAIEQNSAALAQIQRDNTARVARAEAVLSGQGS
ncbi:MAG: hypothetical protein ABI140_19115 [Jatrophihabitantaceae bacterium]